MYFPFLIDKRSNAGIKAMVNKEIYVLNAYSKHSDNWLLRKRYMLITSRYFAEGKISHTIFIGQAHENIRVHFQSTNGQIISHIIHIKPQQTPKYKNVFVIRTLVVYSTCIRSPYYLLTLPSEVLTFNDSASMAIIFYNCC